MIFLLNYYIAIPQSPLLGVKEPNLLRADGKITEAAEDRFVAQAATSTTKESVLEWVKNDKRRMLHVVYRVGDLEKTIKYVNLQLQLFQLWVFHRVANYPVELQILY